MEFEWDTEKDRINREKHGVSFRAVFDDPLSQTVPDPRHSETEYRYVTVGYTSTGRLVVVAHADREERTRIITARQTTLRERRAYESES